MKVIPVGYHNKNGFHIPQYAIIEKTPSRPCTAHDMTFGGRCLNCGGVGKHAPQPKVRS
jgi:hypothetical protein